MGRAGHRVQIVAASWSHVRSVQPAQAPMPVNEQIDGVDYRWLATPPYRGNGLGRVRNIWAFLRRCGGSRRARGADPARRRDRIVAPIRWTSGSPGACAAAKAKLVYEVHDLWPASPIELGGMSPRHPFIVLCQKAENDAYRDADLVVSMLPKVAEHMSAHGLDLRKLVVIPNGMALEEWQGEPTPLARGARHRDGRGAMRPVETIVGYAGAHGRPNALEFLLSAAALLRDAPIDFFLVGDGHEKRALTSSPRPKGSTTCISSHRSPRRSIPSLLAQHRYRLHRMARVPIYGSASRPNKLLDYMMAGCAVLHSVEAGNDPVAEAGCGLTVAPESPTAIAAGIRTLAALAPAERTALGARGQAYVLARHSYSFLAHQFIDAVASSVARP